MQQIYTCHRRNRVNSKENEVILKNGNRTTDIYTSVNGFVINKIDPLYYGLVYKNPQWKYFQKNARVIDILFHNYKKTAHTLKTYHKLIKSPVTGEIILQNDLKRQLYTFDINCFGCNDLIHLDISTDVKKNNVICKSCKTAKYKLTSTDLVKLGNIYTMLRDKIEANNVHYYNLFNKSIRKYK